jgi:hypothetical protein
VHKHKHTDTDSLLSQFSPRALPRLIAVLAHQLQLYPVCLLLPWFHAGLRFHSTACLGAVFGSASLPNFSFLFLFPDLHPTIPSHLSHPLHPDPVLPFTTPGTLILETPHLRTIRPEVVSVLILSELSVFTPSVSVRSFRAGPFIGGLSSLNSGDLVITAGILSVKRRYLNSKDLDMDLGRTVFEIAETLA